MEKIRVLIAEDENIVARDIAYRLKELGYEVAGFARTGADAVAKAGELHPDLVLMDIVLSGEMDGIDAARRIAEFSDATVIYLTAYADEKTFCRAKITDPSGYILKPVESRQLHIAIELSLHRHVVDKRLKEDHVRIYAHMRGVIRAVSETTEVHCPYKEGHHERIGNLAAALARELGLTEFQLESVELASSVYDMGMMNIPLEILLEGLECHDKLKIELYKTYPQAAYVTLKKMELIWPLADIVLQHREHYDGTGFPQGLKGKDMLIEARILSVAHALEELMSNRSYRNALSLTEALAELQDKSGSYYDPNIVPTCLKLFREKGFNLP